MSQKANLFHSMSYVKNGIKNPFECFIIYSISSGMSYAIDKQLYHNCRLRGYVEAVSQLNGLLGLVINIPV